MIDKSKILVYGEVLFDCFPNGEQVLGGAPFNVAWHLQALDDQPQFISSVGEDKFGKKILLAMHNWGMNTAAVELNSDYKTGRVDVKFLDNEPEYTIISECAYDFIGTDVINNLPVSGILYHGTLALRNRISRNTFMQLAQQLNLPIFLDVNLRTPWWKKDDVHHWLKQACWVKLNHDELKLLGFRSADIKQSMSKFQSEFNLQQLIVTQGKDGAIVYTAEGKFYSVIPGKIERFVDTVGAGDAFSAMYLHGLMSNMPIPDMLKIAQEFAGRVIGLRGATTSEPDFYQEFTDSF